MNPQEVQRNADDVVDPVDRVLMLAAGAGSTADPTARALADSDLAVRMVADVAELETELARGAGALFVAVATLAAAQLERLVRALAENPALARVPVFIVGDPGRRQKHVATLAALDNVTLLETPPSDRTIVAAARAALRERQRQNYVGHLLERIEEAEQREERLLATVGHELRNPLGVIATALSLMKRMEGDEGPTARYRGMIERQVETLSRKIDEMLDPDRTPQGDLQHREWPPPPRGRSGDRREAPSARRAEGTVVLVVEDNDDARSALVELLELWGYDVHGAATGEEGTEIASRHDPRIALVDLDLPGIDGHEVARRLRQASRNRLLIAMSGYGQPEDRNRSFAAGFDRHLIKPLDPRRLAHLLEHSRSAKGAA
ncbi:MAG TPA: response regulator [Thermoanaerobaculia bacterium]|nr:response regulator [Thermoanaerobaculia bacterium]